MKRMILSIILIALLLSGCGIMKNYSLEADPFGHTYRVAEVLGSTTPEASAEEKLLINIDALCNLYIMEDTTTYEFQKIGEFKQLELPRQNLSRGLSAKVTNNLTYYI